MKFSIIIPVKALNNYIDESMGFIRQLNYKNFEVLILPDFDEKKRIASAKIIPTGAIGPAEKRDLGAKKATGDILVFLDDDAYPTKNWLKVAEKDFRDQSITAIAGPALTPPNEPFKAKLSAALFESFLGGGNLRFRYLSLGKKREVDDWPSVNLLVRKKEFFKAGGFNCKYWPGEDTKLCLDIIKNGGKIIYDPALQVYHHRRPGLRKHFKQVGNYALHRGFFAKKYPKTSLKLFYFLPSLFVLYLASLVAAVSFHFSGMIFGLPFALYLILLIFNDLAFFWRSRNLSFLSNLGILCLLPGIIFFTNLWYGIRFVWGLFVRDLKR